MKKMKKLLTLLLVSCVLCMNLSITSHAASAELRFNDPETSVGAEVEITATFTATYPVQSMDATLSYDTDKLKFISGSQVTDNNGTLSITGGNGSDVVSVTMTFQALEEGTTVINVTSSKGVDTDGDSIDIVNGTSTIEIGPGDPSLIKSDKPAAGTLSVDVDGVSYTLVEDFSDLVIPEGFERSELELDGGTHTVVKQTTSEIKLAYLQPEEGDADFFLYNSDDATFSPFEQVGLGTGRYLILLDDVSGVKVPADYVETTITMSGSNKTFPAWQSTSEPDYYLVYGLNSDGTEGLYTYDTVDGTYQRLQNSALAGEDDEEVGGKLTNKLLSKLGGLTDLLIVVVVAVVLLLLILLIIIATKLRHRNLELDDLYDEYGIDLEEEEEPVKETRADKKARKKEEKKAKKNKKYDDDLYAFDDDDEYDDYDDSDYEEYESEDEYEDDYEEAFSDYDASDFEDESEIDDLDAMLNARVKKRPERNPMVSVKEPKKKQIGHSDPCDTFKMDLIDLD